MLQDFPFLIVRLIIIIGYRLSKNYMLYYQCGKNLVLCSLEIYRITVIIYDKRKKESQVNFQATVIDPTNQITPKQKQ
jgi:hypothetical protein